MNRTALTRLLLLALLLIGVRAGFAATVEEEIAQAEEARYAAMIARDKATLAQILADEFVYHQPSGKVQNKPGYLEQVTTGEVRITKAQRYDTSTHVYGDTATVMGSTKVDLEMKGEPKVFDLYFLNVWVKRDGRWQIVARQSAFKPK